VLFLDHERAQRIAALTATDPPVYRAFGKLRPKLGRRVDQVPAFPYTFADTEFVQGDGRPE
jgi:hypothetical protein